MCRARSGYIGSRPPELQPAVYTIRNTARRRDRLDHNCGHLLADLGPAAARARPDPAHAGIGTRDLR